MMRAENVSKLQNLLTQQIEMMKVLNKAFKRSSCIGEDKAKFPILYARKKIGQIRWYFEFHVTECKKCREYHVIAMYATCKDLGVFKIPVPLEELEVKKLKMEGNKYRKILRVAVK